MRFNLPQTGRLVTLREGRAELLLAPECGARLVAYRVGGRDILRPASAEALASAVPYGFAAFPLMPYSGPIFGDGFRFAETFHPLSRNLPAEPTATHGEGWIMPWQTTWQSADEIRLSLDYGPTPGAFPFAWRGDIAYRLRDDRLIAEMSLTNTGRQKMPAGMGLHPYFPKAPGTVLRFDATGLWPEDLPDAVDLGAGEIVDGLDFRQGQDIDPIVLDRCYEGWNGRATLTAADGFVTTIEASPSFGKIQIYDAWHYPYICVEPVTNANDGFNRAARGVAGHAVVVLDPMQSLQGRIEIHGHHTTGNAAD